MDDLDIAQVRKQAIRREAVARRNELSDKEAKSALIFERVFNLAEYAAARTVLFYVDVRSEVRTRSALPMALASGRKIVVPYCVDDELALFHLKAIDELEPASFGILEPIASLREPPERRVEPTAIDLVLAPGVAFDHDGGRLGHGHGYYDRLLNRLKPKSTIIGLAYECQLFDEIPMSPHDVWMGSVVTESAVYESRRRIDRRTS